MRRAFTMLGARGTVVLVLAILVLGVVGIAKLAGGRTDNGVTYSDGEYTPSTVDPTAGDDGDVAPTLSAYPDDPTVRTIASNFTTAWLRHDLTAAAWHAGLVTFTTDSLGRSLDGVDPSTVPANRALGPAVISLRTDNYAQASVPVDSGTVKLTLRKQDGKWLVNGVDWERAT